MISISTIIESYITKNKKYTNPTSFKPTGLMLHSVGCAQPDAKVFVNQFNSPNALSVHAFIDANTGDVYQTLPWTYKAAHCGSGSNGSGNNTHIAVEMCEPKEIVYTSGANFTVANNKLSAAKNSAKVAYNAAVKLFAKLCEEFKLDPLTDGVIISHSEGHSRGIASNHADPVHLWKGLGLSYTMNGFRTDVAKAMKDATNAPKEKESEPTEQKTLYRVRKKWTDSASQVGAFEDLNNAKKSADSNPGYKVYNQNGSMVYDPNEEPDEKPKPKVDTSEHKLVQVSISNLNIRTGPGTDHPTNGRFTGRGTFTIVEVKSGPGSNSGWGLLKSYANSKNGWVALDHVKIL